MNHKTKAVTIFIAVLIWSFVLAQQTGLLYEKIIGQNITSWGDYDAEKFEGFFIAFTFLAALLFFGLLDQKRINISITFMLIPALLLLIGRQGDAFLIALAFGLVGLGLGQIIYLIRKKCCQNTKIKS